jgi:hypothetical protein
MPFGCVESTGVLPGGRYKKLYQESCRAANLLYVWTPRSLKMFPVLFSHPRSRFPSLRSGCLQVLICHPEHAICAGEGPQPIFIAQRLSGHHITSAFRISVFSSVPFVPLWELFFTLPALRPTPPVIQSHILSASFPAAGQTPAQSACRSVLEMESRWLPIISGTC